MREFFKEQLKVLHITTGLQQYYKLQEMADGKAQTKMLIDELVLVCTWFPLIPEKEKEKIVLESMLSDQEFIGFNKKIIWKWLNAHNQRFIQSQSHELNRTVIDETKIAEPEIAEKYISEWRESLSRVGNVQPRADGIKDTRIQKLKDDFATLKCIHPNWIYFSDTELICNDCGIKKTCSPSGPETRHL